MRTSCSAAPAWGTSQQLTCPSAGTTLTPLPLHRAAPQVTAVPFTTTKKKRKEKTAPFGVNWMRSQALYRAAQVSPAHSTAIQQQLASAACNYALFATVDSHEQDGLHALLSHAHMHICHKQICPVQQCCKTAAVLAVNLCCTCTMQGLLRHIMQSVSVSCVAWTACFVICGVCYDVCTELSHVYCDICVVL